MSVTHPNIFYIYSIFWYIYLLFPPPDVWGSLINIRTNPLRYVSVSKMLQATFFRSESHLFVFGLMHRFVFPSCSFSVWRTSIWFLFFSSGPFRRKPWQDFEPVVRTCGSRPCLVPRMLQCSYPSAASAYWLWCQTYSGKRPEGGCGRSSETGNYWSDSCSKSE